MKKVYNADQLPSSIEADRIEWSPGDFNIWIEITENNKMRLRGEALEWDEAADDWKSVRLTRDECLDVAEASKLVILSTTGDRMLTDIFKRKVAV